MTTRVPTVVLASESPRRESLLRGLLPHFVVRASRAEEENNFLLPERDFPALKLAPGYHVTPEQNPMLWAWRKAMAVSDAAREYGDVLIVGADTIVVLDDEVLGKPGTAALAREMLRRLARRPHLVITGWVVLRAYRTRPTAGQAPQPDIFTGLYKFGYVSSTVHMADYSMNVIDWYVGTREPLDKAGAYAVQGQGANLVRQVEGCFTNVVGLPVCQIRAVLAAAGVPLRVQPDWNMECAGPYCRQGPLPG
jgi:septum formation protein